MVRVPNAGQIEYMEVHKSDDLRRAVITADILCVVAAYTGVIMRMISRRLVRAGYKADDWLILGGLVNYPVPAYQTVRLILTLGDVHRLYHCRVFSHSLGRGKACYIHHKREGFGCGKFDLSIIAPRCFC